MEKEPPVIVGEFASVTMPPENQLLHAILASEFEWARKSLQYKIDLDSTRLLGKSFLRHAGEKGDRRICEMLVANGCDPNEKNGKHEYSLLHHAVASSNYGFASILLDLGASTGTRTSYKATPLHFAAKTGQEYLASRLLQHHADIDARDHKDMTPLQYAIRRGQFGMARFLIRRRCDVKPIDSREVPESLAKLIAERSISQNEL